MAKVQPDYSKIKIEKWICDGTLPYNYFIQVPLVYSEMTAEDRTKMSLPAAIDDKVADFTENFTIAVSPSNWDNASIKSRIEKMMENRVAYKLSFVKARTKEIIDPKSLGF